jgi:transposase-like protein
MSIQQRYTTEFKSEAVRLIFEQKLLQPVASK